MSDSPASITYLALIRGHDLLNGRRYLPVLAEVSSHFGLQRTIEAESLSLSLTLTLTLSLLHTHKHPGIARALSLSLCPSLPPSLPL